LAFRWLDYPAPPLDVITIATASAHWRQCSSLAMQPAAVIAEDMALLKRLQLAQALGSSTYWTRQSFLLA